MRTLLACVCSLILLLTPSLGYGQAGDDADEAYKIYIAAGMSAAVYNDRLGELAFRYLEQNGWKVDRYAQAPGHAGARFLLAKKELGDGKESYFLAFVGTETTRDISYDLKVEKVYFAGNNIEELAANAAKQGVPTTEPKVHKGFEEFVKSGMSAKTLGSDGRPLLLRDKLLANKDAKLYIVGHSLGGAAAIITGAALINAGVPPEQIEVITFGSPAVGNAAFAAKFDKVLHLTRVVISGDPVTGVLQTLVGGYKQFGKEVLWELPEIGDEPHRIAQYVDLAIKNYYTRRKMQAAGMEPTELKETPVLTKVYVAPLQSDLLPALAPDSWYIRQAWQDEYRKRYPGCTLAEDKEGNWRQQAFSSGYQKIIVPQVSITPIKDEQYKYYVTVNQTIYDAQGAIVEMASFSTATYNLTPLEAFIHTLRGINHEDSP